MEVIQKNWKLNWNFNSKKKMTESVGVNERAEHRLRSSSDQKLHSWAANWIAIQSGKIIHFLGLKYITVSNYFPLKLNKTKSIKKTLSMAGTGHWQITTQLTYYL